MRKLNRKQQLLFAGAITVLSIIWYFKLTNYLTLSYLHANMYELQLMVQKHYWFSVISYCLAYIGTTGLAVPGSSIFTMAGGLLFGIGFGLLYALISATTGAILLFLNCRYFIGFWVQQRYAEKLKGFNEEIALHGHKYLLVVRLLGVLPFGLVTMLSGLTLLSIRTFAWVTFVGLIPVSLVYTYIGRQLFYLESVDDYYSLSALSVFVVFKLALLPALIKITKRLRTKIVTRNAHRSPMIIDQYKKSPEQERRVY